METINLKSEVEKAIKAEWIQFALQHPNLAQVLDQTLLIEAAAQSLADDPEYQDAMRAASAAGTLTETIADFVQKYVGPWLKRLI